MEQVRLIAFPTLQALRQYESHQSYGGALSDGLPEDA
jgi:hypothetical protein